MMKRAFQNFATKVDHYKRVPSNTLENQKL